ncbi:MAG TPA: S41 family peptidase [Chitinophaga sp.]|uniref:S41 family peptidase n=1 Tax=Chitinophaga sp. TaxID=1869181 RepID=UPI002F958740
MTGPIKALTIATCCFLLSCAPQKPAPLAGNYLNDLVLYENILQATHAGLYNYHSKSSIDSIFAYYNTLAGKQYTSTTEFYKYLCIITTYIGSLHDDVFLPDALRDSLEGQKGFFPYPLEIIQDSMVVNTDQGSIPAGAIITAVNGHTTQELLQTLGHYYTTDGYNTTGKKVGIAHFFPWYYAIEYGMQDEFNISYLPYGSSTIKTAVLPAVTFTAYEKLYEKRHSLYLDTLLDNHYYFSWAPDSAPVLTVNTFALGNAESAKHKAYSRFLDSVFTLLKTKHAASLVVDIRKNGGGDDPNDLLTFSYLAYQPYKENQEAYTLFQKLPFKQYYQAEDSSDIPDLESNFKEEHNRLVDGKYYQNPSFNPLWKPNPLAFHGKVYLLVGPQVASAASLFASMVRSENKVIVVGEETMGGYYGHTGHNSVTYQLPDSHISIMLSVVNVKQYVQPLPAIPFGRGIMPQVPLQQDLKGFIDNKDHVLNEVMKLAQPSL